MNSILQQLVLKHDTTSMLVSCVTGTFSIKQYNMSRVCLKENCELENNVPKIGLTFWLHFGQYHRNLMFRFFALRCILVSDVGHYGEGYCICNTRTPCGVKYQARWFRKWKCSFFLVDQHCNIKRTISIQNVITKCHRTNLRRFSPLCFRTCSGSVWAATLSKSWQKTGISNFRLILADALMLSPAGTSLLCWVLPKNLPMLSLARTPQSRFRKVESCWDFAMLSPAGEIPVRSLHSMPIPKYWVPQGLPYVESQSVESRKDFPMLSP